MSALETYQVAGITAFIRESIDKIAESMSGGSASDYADYRHMCGEILAFRLVMEELEIIRKRIVEGKDS